MPRHSLKNLCGGRFAAEEEGRVLLLERAQPAVRRIDHRRRLRKLGPAAGDAGDAGDVPRQAPSRGEGYRRIAPRGGQHLSGRRPATRRRDEQFARGPGQAQRIGKQAGGVLARGAVDATLQVTDAPRAKARHLRQLLLGQPGLRPKPPQQPGEAQRWLLGHGPTSPRKPSARCPRPPVAERALYSGYADPRQPCHSVTGQQGRVTDGHPVGVPVGRHVW